jgi:multidrug resistance efflux pump
MSAEARPTTTARIRTALHELMRPPVAVWRGFRRLAGSVRFWVLLFVCVVLLLIVYYALAEIHTPFTTEAYVQAYVVQVAPQVAEKVIRVHVHEGSQVKMGDLLFELDPALFQQKVASLEAKVVEAQHQVEQLNAELAAAKADHERLVAEAEYAALVNRQEQAIFKTESTTERRYVEAVQKNKASQAAVKQSESNVRRIEDALSAQVAGENAIVAQARADLAEAKLKLSYTRVQAPCDGLITDLQLREGAYVHIGQAAMTLIDTARWMIVANFRETSLTRMHEGQPALIAFRSRPGELFDAKVSTIGWGVSQGQGMPSGQLPDVKIPTSWVPPAQRFQVRLTLDDPNALPFRVGMTGSVAVYTDSKGTVNRVTRFWHKVIAWLYYL